MAPRREPELGGRQGPQVQERERRAQGARLLPCSHTDAVHCAALWCRV